MRRRLFLVNDEPVALCDSYYPAEMAGGTALAEPDNIAGGAYGLIEDPEGPIGGGCSGRSTTWSAGCRRRTRSRSCSSASGVPVVRILRTVYDAGGAAVEVQETIAAADEHQFRYEVGDAMTRLRLGACLSLTGRYGRFGRQAAHGLRVWQQLAGDESSSRSRTTAATPSRSPAAFAASPHAAMCCSARTPRSSCARPAEAMSEVDGLLWNQGGSGDDVQALCPGRIVSVPAPTTRYARSIRAHAGGERERAPLWVVRGRGRFGRQVAAGAIEQARRDELETVEKRTGDGPPFDDVPRRGTCSVPGDSRTTWRS